MSKSDDYATHTYKQFKLNMHTIYAFYELAMTVQKWKMHNPKIPENFLSY